MVICLLIVLNSVTITTHPCVHQQTCFLNNGWIFKDPFHGILRLEIFCQGIAPIVFLQLARIPNFFF